MNGWNWFAYVAGLVTTPVLGILLCVAVWRYDLWRASRVGRES